MLGRFASRLLLYLTCGLCAFAHANTTTDDFAIHKVFVPGKGKSGPAITQQAQLSTTTAQAAVAPAPSQGASVPGRPVRIALLLPLNSTTFGAAAQAVRAGFEAAHAWEPTGLEINIIETAAGAEQALLAYNDALMQHDIIVGPLARSDVAEIVQHAKVSKPTIALAYPDAQGETEMALPPKMFAMGLSIEEDARQLAKWAGSSRRNSKALVIAADIAWQRRAARAFALQWQALGLQAQHMEIMVAGGYIEANSLGQLKKRLQEDKPAVVFMALDYFQGRQLQQALGRIPLVFGTSQLNPVTAADWHIAERAPELNGVHLVDIPWLLQPDHPAVMVYPRPVVPADQMANPDLERLYALGIDAFRLAREIALQRTEFELDGVTGKLSVKLGKKGARFQRTKQPAVYEEGMVVPLLQKH